MPNYVYKAILKSEIEKFCHEFSNTSREVFYNDEVGRIFHNAEYGKYRERIVKQFLRFVIPKRLDINSGFVLTSNNEISTECDIIIYDQNSTPLIQDSEKQNFYPVETVVGIGEIKSTLNKTDLKIALNKLARNKSLRKSVNSSNATIRREATGNFDLKMHPADNIFSFLVCEKLDFNIDNFNINELYDNDIDYYLKHNLLLSIKDGIFLHRYNFRGELKLGLYPTQQSEMVCIQIDDDGMSALEIFSHYMFMGTSTATIYYPDLIQYL